ncbi:hypothetical protein ABBQ38_000627 [Trebouxia sp. C0009 RCD-2024]
MLAPAAVSAPSPISRTDRIQQARRLKAASSSVQVVPASNFRQDIAHNVQQHAATVGAAILLLIASPQSASAGSSLSARQTSGQGDLLNQLLQQNASSGIKAQGPAAQRTFQELSQRMVSQPNSQVPALSTDEANTDSPLDKASGQVKALGKKAQQTTPTGSPTKPQPLQRAGPLEAVNEVSKPALQVASAEDSFKLQGPIGKGSQGYDFSELQGAQKTKPAKKGQFFQSTSQAKPQDAAKAAADKAAKAGSSGTSLLDGILGKPQQAASAAAQKANEAAPTNNPLTGLFSKPQEATAPAAEKAEEAAPSSNPFKGLAAKPKQFSKAAPSKAKAAATAAVDSAKEAVPSGNPLTSLLSKKTDQATQDAKEAVKEAAPSNNLFNSLLTKPKQAVDTATNKSTKAATEASDKGKPAGNPFSGILRKPTQANQEGKSGVQQAAGGAAAAAAAAAAANAVKGLVPEAPSLPAPPSLPNPIEALRSSRDAASRGSLPEAPSIPSVSPSSTGLQQAIALAAAEAIAALVVANIVGALTAKKSGRKAYGK